MSGQATAADCAKFFLDKGAACCVFTLGGDGAYYAHKDGTRLKSPAYDIKIVDTTGCGDAFDAGFITSLLQRTPKRAPVREPQRLVPRAGPEPGLFP